MRKEKRNENLASATTEELKSASLAKPFLKWAGGKGQLLSKFYDFYPDELKSGIITHYYEPFIGGGAVFFEVAQQYNIQSAYLYDINEELILTGIWSKSITKNTMSIGLNVLHKLFL